MKVSDTHGHFGRFLTAPLFHKAAKSTTTAGGLLHCLQTPQTQEGLQVFYPILFGERRRCWLVSRSEEVEPCGALFELFKTESIKQYNHMAGGCCWIVRMPILSSHLRGKAKPTFSIPMFDVPRGALLVPLFYFHKRKW